jgi:phosphoglycolate phosphatase-like HAD superfamily hydrolase
VTYGNASRNQLALTGADFIIDKMPDLLTDVLHFS